MNFGNAAKHHRLAMQCLRRPVSRLDMIKRAVLPVKLRGKRCVAGTSRSTSRSSGSLLQVPFRCCARAGETATGSADCRISGVS